MAMKYKIYYFPSGVYCAEQNNVTILLEPNGTYSHRGDEVAYVEVTFGENETGRFQVVVDRQGNDARLYPAFKDDAPTDPRTEVEVEDDPSLPIQWLRFDPAPLAKPGDETRWSFREKWPIATATGPDTPPEAERQITRLRVKIKRQSGNTVTC